MATKKAKGRKRRHTIPNRADLIKALGLESEGRTRGDKYAATTKEFYAKIVRGESLAARRARRKLGLGT